MKSCKIRGAFRPHMAEDVVNLDCVCVVTPPYTELERLHKYAGFYSFFYIFSSIYCISVCIHVCEYLDFVAYFPRVEAGSGPAVLLSEDWPHVGLCGRVKIETDTRRHWTGGFRLWILLHGFKTPVERPLFH